MRLLLCLILSLPCVAAESAPVLSSGDVDRYVALFNPDIYQLQDGKVVHAMTGAFTAPATDIAREVQRGTWLSLAVFLPFLVLPMVLLLWIVFRFRAKGDGRKPATFMGNHTLEIVWTAIPCLALVIVGIPMWGLVNRMELPPEDSSKDMVVEVRGKSFAWDYKYLRLGGERPTRREDQYEIGQDAAGGQEPLVLMQGRRVILNLTSNDVNHAWWVPAFGIKKDCIKGRYTNAWFTPDTPGLYKGQCTELCGQGHGVMLLSALVVPASDFAVWELLQRHRADAGAVWAAISAKQVDAKAVETAVSAYLAKSDDAGRRFALRWWVTANFVSMQRRSHDLDAQVAPRRAELDRLLDQKKA